MWLKTVTTRVMTAQSIITKLNSSSYVTMSTASFLSSGGWHNAPTVPRVSILYCHGAKGAKIFVPLTKGALVCSPPEPMRPRFRATIRVQPAYPLARRVILDRVLSDTRGFWPSPLHNQLFSADHLNLKQKIKTKFYFYLQSILY